MTTKTVQKFTKELSVLYVEDDLGIRESTKELFSQFFDRIDSAIDGREGLDAYVKYHKENNEFYDFVITDINMPLMNGIEMIESINKINRDQTIIITSAHDDASYLMPLIELGVDSFILKPFKINTLITVFFKNAQKVTDRKFVREHYTQMKIRYKQLKDAFAALQEENNALTLKYEHLLESGAKPATDEASPAIIDDKAYFAQDEDEGEDNILLLEEHSQDLLELFDEVSELVLYGSKSPDQSTIKIVENLAAASKVCEFYAPYLDMLASNLKDVSESIYRNMSKFTDILRDDLESISGLFDAVYRDIKAYVERFKVESMAMKNIHHIHEPTALSIKQIISIIAPDEIASEAIEFF